MSSAGLLVYVLYISCSPHFSVSVEEGSAVQLKGELEWVSPCRATSPVRCLYYRFQGNSLRQCVLTGRDGRDGKNGRDGRDGDDGRDGRDGIKVSRSRICSTANPSKNTRSIEK